MGSRQADSLALAGRCEKVGWRVENSTRGIKVYNDAGRMFTIHKSYSDVNSLSNATRDLERGGLLEAERAMAELKFQSAQDTITKARKSAAKKATAMAAEGAKLSAVAKAAGPYLTDPEDVLISWFAEPHPSPWMRWVNITAEIAHYLLATHNTANRPINAKNVEHYKNIILSGQWHMTHQGIAMDTEAVLQDGQHRLAGVEAAAQEVLEADGSVLKVPFAFFVGMPPENFKAIDEGLLRNAAQLFSRDGEKNGGTMQTSIRLVIAYRTDNPRGRFRLKFTNEAILDTFAENPDEFRRAASVAQSHYRKLHTAAGPFAAAMYLLRKANGEDNQFVSAFIEGLMTGRKAGTRVALDDDDPRAVYRETMQNARIKGKRFTGLDQLGMLIISWNNLVNSYSPRYMRFADDAPIPRIVVCQDKGPKASVCPAALYGELDEDDQ